MLKKIFVFILAIAAFFIFSGFLPVEKTNNKKSIVPFTSAQAAVLMEKGSQRILYEKNKAAKLPMASCTKILTALVMVEHCDINETVIVPQQAVGIEGSSIYLKCGEKLSVKELLYGLLLRSGNDSAVTLALHVSKNLDDFSKLMNETARECGALNSNFVTPHGLDAKGHYTTAEDLAKITCCALNNNTISEIVSSKKAEIGNIDDGNFRILHNKNKLLKNYQFADGVKTGYTKKAGRCFVGSATNNGMQLVCVVLNCGPMFEETQALLTYGFDNFYLRTIVPKNKVFKETNGDKSIFYRCDRAVTYPLSSDGTEETDISYRLTENCGNFSKLEISFKNKLLFCQKLSIIYR